MTEDFEDFYLPNTDEKCTITLNFDGKPLRVIPPSILSYHFGCDYSPEGLFYPLPKLPKMFTSGHVIVGLMTQSLARFL